MDEASKNVIAAFSEERTSRLTGISQSQLRYWDRTDFFHPSYEGTGAFSRVYSFKDIVNLRVLNLLRNEHGVSLTHLRSVGVKLAALSVDQWTGVRLWVLRKKVVWEEPGSQLPQEILSGQYVVAVALAVMISDTKREIAKLSARRESVVGTVSRSRFVNHNVPVVAGTRIPVEAIKRFRSAGYSIKRIIAEYPDLTKEDIKAALAYEPAAA